MKLNKQVFLCSALFCIFPSTSFSFSEQAQCGDPISPLLSVADFDGNGVVNRQDMHMLKDAMHGDKYLAIFDRNGDGKLNYQDKHLTKHDMEKSSTDTDQRLAKMYQRFKHLQNTSAADVTAMNFSPFGSVLAFHGQHWLNSAGQLSVGGFREADPFIAEGVNVTADGSEVLALFWGNGSTPLFTDPAAASGLSTLDWPSPTGVWNFQRVQAFADTPPDFFPESDADRWHPHAGLCATVQDLGNGPEWVLDQYTSNAECQATPNLKKSVLNGQEINLWGNFWMIHAWLYELNPRGVFGNVHPCVDPDGASEADLNGDREVPPFFEAIMNAH